MNEITETRKPPVATTGILGWLRMNLFSNWINSLISLFVLYILIQFIPWILNLTIFAADFKYNLTVKKLLTERCAHEFLIQKMEELAGQLFMLGFINSCMVFIQEMKFGE